MLGKSPRDPGTFVPESLKMKSADRIDMRRELQKEKGTILASTTQPVRAR